MVKAKRLLPAFLLLTATAFAASSDGNAAAAWKKAGADDGLRQAFERAMYSVKDGGNGTWRGANAAQRLTLEFSDQGARLSHPDGSVTFRLTGYGYGDRLVEPASAKPKAVGNRVEYQRGDLTEWYVNGPQGLEQGFTLVQRPGTDLAGEPLVIALGVSGELLPAQEAKPGAVVLGSGKGVVLRYAGLKALDARGRALPSRLEVRGDEIRLVVEDHDAQYPLLIDPTWTQEQEMIASDGAANDLFGYAVSVSGDTAVVGAQGKTINSHAYQGAAYVFVRADGVWTQQAELTASDGAADDEFGVSVSVSGDTAVVGAHFKTVNSHATQGAAYVFVRSGGVWSQQAELTGSDGAAGDQFGSAVSVNGDTAVVGAFVKTINSQSGQGAAYVFVRSGAVWSQQQELITAHGGQNDWFGYSVSVNGDTALIGALEVNQQGLAWVFVRSGGVWSEQGGLLAFDGGAGDNFGVSVSVNGDTALIGASGHTVNSRASQGAAYVFVRSDGAWSQQQELIASDGAAEDSFGASVSVSADTAVIGASVKTITSNSDQGAVYVFVRSGDTWSQQQELTGSDGAANDRFGYSVSVSGDTAVIGAPFKTINSLSSLGAAYVFVRPRLGTNAVVVGSAGGSSSVVLAYSGEWTATANNSFLHISAGSANGSGNALIVFTYDAFAGAGSRTGTLTIAGLTLTVTQAGTNYMGPGPVVTLVPRGVTPVDDVAVDSNGYVYIANTFDSMIKEWRASSNQVTALVSSGLAGPHGIAVDGAGNVFIADTNDGAVKEWDAGEQQLITLVSGLDQPLGVAVDVLGNVYIADTGNNAIKEWNASTRQVTTLVSGLNEPFGVAVDVAGNVYIADSYNNAIKEWNALTTEVTTLVSSGLSSPLGVAVDGSGNVYIADTGNNAIKEWSASTQQVTTLLASGLNFPGGVAVDGTGNVYIADNLNEAIKEIPNVYIGPTAITEPVTAGSDALLPVLPSTTSLTGFFEPTSDQSWLTIGSITNGAIGFSFSANTSTSPRVAHIAVLGHQITVGQDFTTPAEFSDVPSTASYYDAANLMFLTGVTTGCVGGSTPQTRMFCPNDSVTREEMAAFIVRAVTGTTTPANYNPTPYFTDVPTTNPFFPHIQKMEELGITDGCATGLFCPTDTIPRWEMAIFMVRARLALYGANFSFNPVPYFADVPTNVEGNGVPFPFIQRAYEEHITSGCGTSPLIYCPDELVTRGQMASFIMRGLFNETTLLGPTAPILTDVSPNAMASTPGTQISVTITGVNTNFQMGDTVTVPSGMLAVSDVTVNSATSISAMLTANANIVAGPQALVVTSGGMNLTLPLAVKAGTY